MTPLFISGASGRLFAVYWSPADKRPTRAILHLPAFADEMNKSRRMVAEQARAFVQQGFAVLTLDLFGTGESDGDFGDATWDIWLQNVDEARRWLAEQGIDTVFYWGLRTGALLAMDYIQRRSITDTRLLCWHPVLNGETFVMQFLRLRVAAAMMNSDAPREKTSDLKQQLLSGQSLEVAGYRLHADLIKPILALKAQQMQLSGARELAIFEMTADAEGAPTASNVQWTETLQAQGIACGLATVVGDQFWTTQEIIEVPALIMETNNKVSAWLTA
ncbi:MAG: hydrolase 2, exosortase A system-associated [Methylomicrobium sp.]|nr:hydrolase 2, exosortase A system-associated [Methylomicrobium sp.]